jgi:uncharacterized protein (TIGR00369 family)
MTREDLQQVLDESPFHRLFDMHVAAIDAQANSVTLALRFSAAVERAAGTGQYHGGVIASLIDIAGDFAIVQALGHGVPTINFRVDYLRPATGDLSACAVVRRTGRTVCLVDIDVKGSDGRVVALGRGCYASRQG